MKQRKILIISIIILVLGLLVFWSLPFLFEKEIYSYELSFDQGKVMIISDIHLDSNLRDLSCIGDYVMENNISYLILNGDIFDRLHREELKEEFLEEVLRRLDIKRNSPQNIIYILALYNHDPYFKTETQNFKNGREILVLKGILKLKSQEELFYIFHGDYILDNAGIGVAILINKLASGLFFERFAKRIIQLKEEWLILGHSHLSGIDYQRKVANSGPWIDRIISAQDTAVLIGVEEGEKPNVNLVKIPCEQ